VAIRVLLADDQPLVRAGFRALLERADDIEVVAEAATGRQAVAETRTHRPDVVLMDVRMPDLDGIEATRRIVALDGAPVRVLMLTTFDLAEYLLEALDAGVSGFTLKDTPPDDLVAGVLAVARNDALVEPETTVRLIGRAARHRPAAPLDALSAPERELLDLVAAGRSDAEIGPDAGERVSALLAKLGVRDRVHAVLAARRG